MEARGIRNNNPLNLDFIAPPERPWNGQIGQDGPFAVYDTPANGVRAASHQLQKDYGEGQTLSEIITDWAPPAENDTAAYISAVSTQTGIDPNATFDLHANLPALVTAMILHENGIQPYNPSDIAQWVYL